MIFALAVFTFVQTTTARAADHELASQPEVVRMFWQLLQQASYGRSDVEEAAFIVKTQSGELSCVLWPSAGQPNSGRWIGDLPPDTVAIAHTHPNRLPVPSAVDMHTAATIGIPVYVVTNVQIYKTSGSAPELVHRGAWRPEGAAERQ